MRVEFIVGTSVFVGGAWALARRPPAKNLAPTMIELYMVTIRFIAYFNIIISKYTNSKLLKSQKVRKIRLFPDVCCNTYL